MIGAMEMLQRYAPSKSYLWDIIVLDDAPSGMENDMATVLSVEYSGEELVEESFAVGTRTEEFLTKRTPGSLSITYLEDNSRIVSNWISEWRDSVFDSKGRVAHRDTYVKTFHVLEYGYNTTEVNAPSNSGLTKLGTYFGLPAGSRTTNKSYDMVVVDCTRYILFPTGATPKAHNSDNGYITRTQSFKVLEAKKDTSYIGAKAYNG